MFLFGLEVFLGVHVSFVLLSFASSRLLRVCFCIFFASFRIFLFEAKKGHPMQHAWGDKESAF
jgi:hypothetical protein